MDYSSDGLCCFRQPSSRQSPSPRSPKTFLPSLDSTNTSPVRPRGAFGQTTERPPYPSLIVRFNARAALSSLVFGFQAEGQTKTIISLASNHTCLRVPSATRPKVVSPTSGLCAPLKYKISVPIVTIIVNNTATWPKMFLNCPHSPLQKI